MPLTNVDRTLLQRCLQHHRGAWNDFVDRYLGLIYHVVHFTAHQRSVVLQPEDVEDLAAEVLLQIVANNYQALQNFRGQSSLATYLTVISRRTCIQELVKRAHRSEAEARHRSPAEKPKPVSGLETFEEVQRLMRRLPSRERDVVRMSLIERRTYEEISTALHLPVNSIGPILSRAKKRLQNGATRDGRPPKSEPKTG